jgi:Uma2 family endonuclease
LVSKVQFQKELKSPSDNLKQLKSKMLKWSENGAQLGCLIDPANKQLLFTEQATA